MRRSLVTSTLALALASLAGTATANRWYDDDDRHGRDHRFERHHHDRSHWVNARVIDVDPIVMRSAPRWEEQCWQEPVRVVVREPVPFHGRGFETRPRHGGIGPSTGQVLGGIVGAAVGSQIGDGDGQRAATVAGALLGTAIARDHYRQRVIVGGRPMHHGFHDGMVERELVRYESRCRRVESFHDEHRVIGYHVTYVLHGRTFTTRTDHHPGRTLPVRVDVRPWDN